MSRTNLEILGRVWNGYITLQQSYERDLELTRKKDGSPCVQHRVSRIERSLRAAALCQLGCIEISDIRDHIRTSNDLCVEYFCTDWWTSDAFDRVSPEVKQRCNMETELDVKAAIEENAAALDRNHPERKLQWYTALQGCLLFGGLLDHWDDVSRVCAWFDETIEPEYTAGTVEDQLFQFFVCVAGQLGPLPFDRFAPLVEQVRKCRLKRPRLLFTAWDAAIRADQDEFNTAFLATMKHFVAKPSDIKLQTEWVALHQSIIALIAQKNGLTVPVLPEKETAAIITRQSLGLEG